MMVILARMIRARFSTTLCLILAFAAALCAARIRADGTVYVTMNGFSPSSISIDVGEAVYFVVNDDYGPYCVQSTIGAWTPWYLWDYGDWVRIQFNEKGDYYYRDAFSYNSGVVHVGTVAPNQPPLLTITSPTNGAVFTEPASFIFSANATDPDGGILLVEFYVDANLVDGLYSTPYTTQVTNLAAGNYTLSVTAYDTAWASTNKSISITVQPPSTTITLRPPRLLAGEVELEATGVTAGKQAVLETSLKLGLSASWLPVRTNAITADTTTFTYPLLPGSRFFRVRQTP